MRIVSFTRSVAFDGIPHAGGEYYLRHLRALLSAGHQVTVVAPDDAENRDGAVRSTLAVDVLLIGAHGPSALHYVDRLNVRFRVAVPPERFVRNVVSDPRVLEAVASADVLEYQWTEFSYIHGRLSRSLAAGKPSVAVAHDVLTEKFAREAQVEGLPRRGRLIARAKSALVLRDERRMLGRMTRVLTFSDKDARRLGTMIGPGRAQVVDPPLEPNDPRWPAQRTFLGREVLFVGAFYRPENSDGAMWFVREIWPLVVRSAPDARLVLAGVGPDARMQAAAAVDPSITITGYVDDLVPHYLSASVAVVPLLAGAGVKFKTITAMLWGVPVVATPIGVEGIGERAQWADHFVAVTAEPEEFADAILRALLDPASTARVGDEALRFAVRRYGAEDFARRIGVHYAELGGG